MDIRSSRALALAALIGVLPLAGACATPIGVSLSGPKEIHRAVTRSVLTNGQPSAATEQFLQRLGLAERFDKNPVGTIEQLRGQGTGLSRDRLFALAELSFIYAQQENRQDHYLAAAVYAYAFLFRKDGAIDDPLDSRTRLAADLYNFGLALALAVPPGPAETNDRPTIPGRTSAEAEATDVTLTDRTLSLPFGLLELRGNASEFVWGGLHMSRFVSVGEFSIRGLRNRYRQPGIGAALAAEVSQDGSGPEADIARKYIPKRVKVPVTAFVRLEDVSEGIATGQLRGRLELYPSDEALTVEVEGRKLPLEQEFSAVFAYALEGASVWDTEFGFFLSPGRRTGTRSHHAASLPGRADSGRARSRYGVEPRTLGGHDQRAPERPPVEWPHPVLALHLFDQQPDPPVGERATGGAPRYRQAARSGRPPTWPCTGWW